MNNLYKIQTKEKTYYKYFDTNEDVRHWCINHLNMSEDITYSRTTDKILANIKDKLEVDSWAELAEIGNKLNEEDDFTVEIDSREYRFISADTVEEVFDEECQQLIEDCYDLSNIPNFIAIDWESTVAKCRYDGLGHQFAHYDGEEIEIFDIQGKLQWHVFRTN